MKIFITALMAFLASPAFAQMPIMNSDASRQVIETKEIPDTSGPDWSKLDLPDDMISRTYAIKSEDFISVNLRFKAHFTMYMNTTNGMTVLKEGIYGPQDEIQDLMLWFGDESIHRFALNVKGTWMLAKEIWNREHNLSMPQLVYLSLDDEAEAFSFKLGLETEHGVVYSQIFIGRTP